MKRVLLVDDTESIHQIGSMMFKKYKNVELLCAYNGRQALIKVEALGTDIDLIMLDLKMPIMGGLEFLEILKYSAGSSIPVILTIERGQEEEAEKSVELGVEGYVIKPFISKELRKAIEPYILEDSC